MKKTKRQIALIAMVLFVCINFKNDLYASGGDSGGSSAPPPPPNAEVIRKSPIPLKTDGKFVVSEDMVKCIQWEEFNEIKDSKLYRDGSDARNTTLYKSIDPYIEADECIEGVLGGTDTKLYENSLLIESDGTYDKNTQVSKTTNQKMPEVFCSKKYSKIHYGQPYEFICADGKIAPTCSDNDVKEYGCKKGEQYCTKCVETESEQYCTSPGGGSGGNGGSSTSCRTYSKCVKYGAIPPTITKSVKFNSKRCVKWELAYPIGKATIDPNNIEF